MRYALAMLAALAASPVLAAPQTCALIANGVVVNTILADPLVYAPSDGQTLDCSNPAAQIGWTFAGGVYTTVAPPVVYQTSGLTFLQFMALFTPTEQGAIVGSTDTQVRLFLLMATGAGAINLGDAQVQQGIGYLTSLGIVAPARVAVILAGKPHP